ncbi:MAG: YebC/PmpR family DNA-binding transcriptional regulator [Patescibacteria group bacterium]
MSGHSKWAQIKHKKAVSDQKRGRVFSKLARAITVAACGNPDPKSNVRLRAAMEAARKENMPNENIDRAVQKVSDVDSARLEELSIEILGPGNTALVVSAITDSRNRTMQEIKRLVALHAGRIMEPGSLAWMFRAGASAPLSESEASALSQLVVALQEHDDVQGVQTNIAPTA